MTSGQAECEVAPPQGIVIQVEFPYLARVPTAPRILDLIAFTLLEAGQASEGLEERALLWRELLRLLEPEAESPPPSRRLQEIPFVAACPEAAVRIPVLLQKLGLKPGRPFRRGGRPVVPVYTQRTDWLCRLLALAGPPQRERRAEPGAPVDPEQLAEVAAVMREAGRPSRGLQAQARLWRELQGEIQGVRCVEDAHELIVASRESAVLLCRALRSLGLPLGRPFSTGVQVIMPVYGGSSWWSRLLEVELPAPEAPLPPEGADPCKVVVRVWREAGLPAEGLEEKAHTWLELRPSFTAYPRGRPGADGWEGRLVVSSAARASELSELLHQLGVDHPPPILQRDGEVVLSVEGCSWLGRLLEPGAPSAGARVQGRRWPSDAARVLQIVARDRTFELSTWRGRSVWAGRCLQCDELLLVGLDGQPISSAQLVQLDASEHGLLCIRCATRARSLQRAHDPRASETWERLLARQRERTES
jgi:hypothetical protein